MLQPKKLLWPKVRKSRIRGLASRNTRLAYGDFGFKALKNCRITSRQIETVRRILSRATKRQGKIWIKIFPHIPISQKPAEVRMGSGKGSVSYYVSRVNAGTVLFEFTGTTLNDAKKILSVASCKLPIKLKLVFNKRIL